VTSAPAFGGNPRVELAGFVRVGGTLPGKTPQIELGVPLQY